MYCIKHAFVKNPFQLQKFANRDANTIYCPSIYTVFKIKMNDEIKDEVYQNNLDESNKVMTIFQIS